MPVEVKLRPIHVDMPGDRPVISGAPFRALDSRDRCRFLWTDLREGSDLALCAIVPAPSAGR